MQKVVLALSLIVVSSFAGEEFSPQHIGAVQGISCTVQNFSGPTNCGESSFCSEGTVDLEYFADFPYNSCVQSICAGYPNNLYEVSVNRDHRAELTNQQIGNDFAPLASSLYDALKANANEANNHLQANPALAESFRKTRTIMELQERITRIATNTEDGDLMEKRRFMADHARLYPGWGEQLVSLNYDLLNLVKERMQNNQEIVLTSKEIVRPEYRRLLLGRLEQRVRALPASHTSKQELLNTVFDFQSANQLDGVVPNEFNTSVYAVLAELNLYELLATDPQARHMQDNIYALASQRNMTEVPNIYNALLEGQDKEDFVYFCVQNIALQAESFPTRAERLALQDRMRLTRETIKQRALGSFSAETRSGVRRAIDGADLALPPAREDYLQRMRGLLSEKRGVLGSLSLEDQISSSMHYSNLPGANLGLDLCRLPFYADDGASALTTRSLDSNGHLGHHHLVTMGNFYAEDYENLGEHVYAHELGHVVSKQIEDFASRESKHAHKQTKQCLNINQVGGGIEHLLGSLTGNKLARGLKAEEDYADIFAFLALPTARNPKCAFFDNGQPANGSMNTLNSPNDSLHSSHLYRLLHGEVAKNGRINDVCRAELRENGQEFREQNCWNNAAASSR